MSLAIFDLDNTLLGGDSDHQWGEFLVEKQLVNESDYRDQNNQFYKDYQNGCLDIYAFLKFALHPLTLLPVDELEKLHQEFMQEKITPLFLPKARDLLDWHRNRGDQLLIITATNRFITGPIAKSLGIEHILATEPEMREGRYTGEVAGTPCFQEGKVIRLNTWLDEFHHSFTDSYFYSDSINDLALLEKVDHPIAVDPDNLLRAHAQSKNWKIISLRS